MFKAINQGEESFSSLDFNRPVECTSAMASFLVEKQRCTGNNRTNYCVNYLLICINYWSVSQLINKLSFHLSSLYTAVSPSINLTVGILPHVPSLNNMAAWLDGHNNPSSWQWRYRNEGETWMGGGERRHPTESADTVSLKHKGDSWRWGRSRERPKSHREKDTDSLLCLPHCLPARSLPLSPYLAVLPLTSSQQPLSFFISLVALPPSHSTFTSLCLPGIYKKFLRPPSTCSPIPFPGYLSTCNLPLLRSATPSRSFPPLLSKWLL